MSEVFLGTPASTLAAVFVRQSALKVGVPRKLLRRFVNSLGGSILLPLAGHGQEQDAPATLIFSPSPLVGAGFKPALCSDNATAGRFETCPYEISPYPRCTLTRGERQQDGLAMAKAFMRLP
ncbi:MAG: hypothetical protein LBU53_09145 [Zoogloeaceae bacterium]|nr:hypothetical protein [Zoogloeaceae bacterium]